MFTKQCLIIPEKVDSERSAVANTWQKHGGKVLALGRFWEPPPLNRAEVRLYGNDTFCLVLAQQLELHLISPPDDLLLHLDTQWVKRTIQKYTLATVERQPFPQFIKPLIPKQFRASVYPHQAALQAECKGLDSDTEVLVSEIVTFVAEARTFILKGTVETCAIYEGVAPLEEAQQFATLFAKENALPPTCVIDIGYLPDKGWAVVEANATWGAGLNGCDPLGAAKCIAQATHL